jgi:hypothetical protein
MSIYEMDWRAESRAEMFVRVIVALDEYRLWMADKADPAYDPDLEPHVRYIETVLFPFLEAEKKSAQGVPEGGGQVVRLRLTKPGEATDAERA